MPPQRMLFDSRTRGQNALDDVAGLVTGCRVRGYHLTQETRWMTWQAISAKLYPEAPPVRGRGSQSRAPPPRVFPMYFFSSTSGHVSLKPLELSHRLPQRCSSCQVLAAKGSEASSCLQHPRVHEPRPRAQPLEVLDVHGTPQAGTYTRPLLSST
jgi:hypothetical protein